MLFNSHVFLYAFLPLAILGYYGAARLSGSRAAKVWLCIASFVFYGWLNPALDLLLAASIAFNFVASRHLLGDRSGGSPHQGGILFAAVAADLLLLFYYKYLFPLLDFFHAFGWT